MTVQGMLDKLNAIDINSLFADSISETEEYLIAVNQEQLKRGMNANGQLMPDYSDQSFGGYGEYKLRKNPLNDGRFDLNNTGALWRNMTAYFGGNEVFIDSGVSYAYHYSEYAFGVYENEWLQSYRELYLYPKISENLKIKLS